MTMLITIGEITHPIEEWAQDYGIPVALIRSRLRRGWSEERAVTEPMVVRRGERLPPDAMVDALPAPKVAKPPLPRLVCRPASASMSSVSKPNRKKRGNPREITFEGQTFNITEWAARLGLNFNTLSMRLHLGWPLERALTQPRGVRPGERRPRGRRGGRTLEHDGRTMTVKQWAAHLGLHANSIRHRLAMGYPIEAVLDPETRRGFRPVQAGQP